MLPAYRPFTPDDLLPLITLWETCGLTRPWNDPQKDIERALSVSTSEIWVGEINARLMASAMLGYDGHRGNVYYFCIHPDFQHQGIGTDLMKQIESHFQNMGCPKVHLMVRSSNVGVSAFYHNLGYKAEETQLHGKRLISDD